MRTYPSPRGGDALLEKASSPRDSPGGCARDELDFFLFQGEEGARDFDWNANVDDKATRVFQRNYT